MCAVRNPFEKVARTRPNKYNWESKQIGVPQNIDAYLKTSHKLTSQFDAYTTAVKDILGINIDVLPASVKSHHSASRKLNDSNVCFQPEKIKDYLRTTFTIPDAGKQSIDDLQKVINYLRYAPETVGFKDQFSEPDRETGFRSFKAHVLVQNPENPTEQIIAEIIVQHAGMEKANEQTKVLRSMERRIREVSSAPPLLKDYVKASARLTISEDSIRHARKDVHDVAAQRLGLNVLLDPSVEHLHECDITKSMDRLARQGGNKHVKNRVATILQTVFGR